MVEINVGSLKGLEAGDTIKFPPVMPLLSEEGSVGILTEVAETFVKVDVFVLGIKVFRLRGVFLDNGNIKWGSI